jgi:hypothetical protein
MYRFANALEISAAILAAPAWARVGLTVRDPRLRERAAQELAETVLDRLEAGPALAPHPDQLALAL